MFFPPTANHLFSIISQQGNLSRPLTFERIQYSIFNKSISQIEPLIFLFMVPIAVRINLTFDISLDASNNFLMLYCGIRLQPTILIQTIFPLIVVCIL